jgi:hypothetical protein
MDIEKSGELESTSPEEIFAAVYRARAYGIAHFKSPEGTAVFVTFERGLAQHASGGGLDGEAAVEAVLSWEEGDYRFIDDIRPDDDDFPPNVSQEVAESLGATAETRSAEASVETPPLPVLPAGEAAGEGAAAETADGLFDDLADERFTGCCAVGPASSRRGLFVFTSGVARGGLLWDGESVCRGDEARAVFDANFGRYRGDLEFLKLDEETAGVLALGLTAGVAIARIPAAAVNIEEYLAWVQRETGTVLVSIVAGRGSANILLKSGEMLGAVIAPGTAIHAEPDEALALYYSPGATIEAFAEIRRTP